jgi:hypothetical protein
MPGVPRLRRSAWILWGAFLGGLALDLLIPRVLPSRPQPWDAAQTAVAEFILAIFSLIAAVGTFTLRETFALGPIRRGSLDPSTPAGFARVRATLLGLWSLCLLIGLFGSILAYAAANPAEAWPYVAGAAVLLVVHAPRARLFESSTATPVAGGS